MKTRDLDGYYLKDPDDPPETKSKQERRAWIVYRGIWFACRQPERPHDTLTRFHDRCRACMLSVEAAQMRGAVLADGMLETMLARLEEHGEAKE